MGANDKLAATFHGGNTDPRVMAALRAIGDERHERGFGIIDDPRHLVERMLAAADEADRAAGIVRVRVDDQTVERGAIALWVSRQNEPWQYTVVDPKHVWDRLGSETRNGIRAEARAVLAALRGES